MERFGVAGGVGPRVLPFNHASNGCGCGLVLSSFGQKSWHGAKLSVSFKLN